MDNLMFEVGDFVKCSHHGQEFKAHIEKCPRPDADHRIYMVRIYGGRGLTHALESNLTMVKARRQPQDTINYRSTK